MPNYILGKRTVLLHGTELDLIMKEHSLLLAFSEPLSHNCIPRSYRKGAIESNVVLNYLNTKSLFFLEHVKELLFLTRYRYVLFWALLQATSTVSPEFYAD